MIIVNIKKIVSLNVVELATLEIIEKINNMLLNYRRLKVPEIVEAIGISHA